MVKIKFIVYSSLKIILLKNMASIGFVVDFDVRYTILTSFLKIVFQFQIQHIIIIVLAKAAFVANK